MYAIIYNYSSAKLIINVIYISIKQLAILIKFECLTSFLKFLNYLFILEKNEGRERDINLLFHWFMHPLVDSCMCPDGGSSLQAWHFQTMLLKLPSLCWTLNCHNTKMSTLISAPLVNNNFKGTDEKQKQYIPMTDKASYKSLYSST